MTRRRPPAPDTAVEQAQLERLAREQAVDERAALAYGRRDEPRETPSAETNGTVSLRTDQEPKRTRRDPAGMSRRSLYLSDSTWTALHDATNQVQAAAAGLISKHEAVSILVDLAVSHVDDAATQAREQVQQRLGG